MNRDVKNKLKTLDYSAIKPNGWLLDQLQLQMDGITGSLDEYWGSVGIYSDWIGGTDNSWERPPYWLDGLVPLSYLLKDDNGIAKVKKWLEWSLNSQRVNGDFGPAYRTSDFDESLFWPKFVMVKAFISYYEASKDSRVIAFMIRYFRFCSSKLDNFTMSSWAQARGSELAYAILWLYDRTNDEFLMEVLKKVNVQTLDWTNMFEEFPFTKSTCYYYKWEKLLNNTNRNSLYSIMQYHYTHVVNVAMGIKQPLVNYRATGEKRYLDIVYKGLEALYKYHGQVSGVFSGDEHLNGVNPIQGTELCAVVELMFSLQLLLEATGDPMFADMIERVAYNALPATISEDFKAHQYDQQANQVLVSIAKRNWYNNEDDSNLFGFEPNFGCCLANMHQGWPKFLKNAIMVSEDNVYAMVYMPLEADVEISSKRLSIISETQYPFMSDVNYIFKMDKETAFKFNLRIPKWCSKYIVLINKQQVEIKQIGQFVVIDRNFRDNDTISIRFEMPIVVNKGWYNNSASVERGPLVFGLNIKEAWQKLDKGLKEYPYYEIYPETQWNYALNLDKEMVAEISEIRTKQAFSHDYAPVKIKANAFIVPTWKLQNNSAGELPISPVTEVSNEETIELIPYGCAKLRISLFPWADSFQKKY